MEFLNKGLRLLKIGVYMPGRKNALHNPHQLIGLIGLWLNHLQ